MKKRRVQRHSHLSVGLCFLRAECGRAGEVILCVHQFGKFKLKHYDSERRAVWGFPHLS